MSEKSQKTTLILSVVGVGIAVGVAVVILLRAGFQEQQEQFVQQSAAPVVESAQGVLPSEEELKEEESTASTFSGEQIKEATGSEIVQNNLFSLQLTDVERKTELGSVQAGEGNAFLLLSLRVQNISGSSRTLVPLAELVLVDDQEREYSVALLEEGAIKDNLDGYQSFDRDEKKEGQLAYLVYEDAEHLRVEYRHRNAVSETEWLTILEIE